VAKPVMLDKNREYGEVMGGSGPRYEQDGKLFDVAGKLYVAPPRKVEDDEAIDPLVRLQVLKEQLQAALDENEKLRQELAKVVVLDDEGDGFPDLPGSGSAETSETSETSEVDEQLAKQGVL